jgi:hypothetical protein
VITLTNAVPPFDGDLIEIASGAIKTIVIDHTLANGDCTRVTLDDGEFFQVKEAPEEIVELILGEEHATKEDTP